MRRRKKLWIACAALVVVVALCAFALLYHPVPYRFMEGARYEETRVYSIKWAQPSAVRSYRMLGSLVSIKAAAKEELTEEDGWRSYKVQDGSGYFVNADSLVRIAEQSTFGDPKTGRPRDEPGAVYVTIAEPPTLLDRFYVWLHRR